MFCGIESLWSVYSFIFVLKNYFFDKIFIEDTYSESR